MTTPKQYRKKPVTIEAMQLTHRVEDAMKVTAWMVSNLYPWLIGDATEPDSLRYPDQEAHDETRPDKGIYIDPADGALRIRTLEGDMRATDGDYIIRGVQGEFYPCRPDVFAASYEEVTP